MSDAATTAVRTAAEHAARARVVVEARRWLRTPYVHGAGVRGAGVDCAHLVAAAFAAAGVLPPLVLGTYPPDWFLHTDEDLLAPYLARFFRLVEPRDVLPGDVALFRFGRAAASHLGIVVDVDEAVAGGRIASTMIHAARGGAGGGAVVLETLAATSAFADRLVGFAALRDWTPRRLASPEPA